MRTAASASTSAAAKRRTRPARLPRGVNPDPELGIFLEHFLIPLRLIGSGHSIPSPKPRVSDGAIFQILTWPLSIRDAHFSSMGSHLKMPPIIVPVSNFVRILRSMSSDGRRQLLARCLLQVHCPLLPRACDNNEKNLAPMIFGGVGNFSPNLGERRKRRQLRRCRLQRGCRCRRCCC